MSTTVATRTYPFNLSSLPFDVDSKKWVEVQSDSKLYDLLLHHISSGRLDIISSFNVDVVKDCGTAGCDDEDEDDDIIPSTRVGRISLKAGLGTFEFSDHTGMKLFALHQTIGNPVGTDCGAKLLQNLVVFTDNSIEDMCRFFTFLIDESEKSKEGIFTCFKWHNRYNYWKSQEKCKARPLDSVILPRETKDRIIGDMERFLSPKTKGFFEQHGIPYRRSYLFYGVPGTGKTSLIQALAGHFKRSISYLQPTHPDFTDDALREAMNKLPKDTIVVFEDLDSLFAKDRSSKVQKSSLTFSGLLNALDGVGSTMGQIFILTTNLRDQLDPALIRYGRVDVQVPFLHASQEQMEMMWTAFYPDSADRATEFATSLSSILGDRPIAASGLQHFFVSQMMSSAEEAIENLARIIEEMSQYEQKEAEEKEAIKKESKKKKSTKKAVSKTKTGASERASSSSSSSHSIVEGSRHIHIYLHESKAGGDSAALADAAGSVTTATADSDHASAGVGEDRTEEKKGAVLVVGCNESDGEEEDKEDDDSEEEEEE